MSDRDHTGDDRDHTGDDRDHTGDDRDHTGDEPDFEGHFMGEAAFNGAPDERDHIGGGDREHTGT